MNKLRMRNKKGAIELSLNFVVILIISILSLMLSIVFLKNLFTAAYQKQTEVDYRTQEQIKALLRDGEKVALPVTTQTIRRGDSAVFGLGILNIGEDETDFFIVVSYLNPANEDNPLTPATTKEQGYDVNGGALILPSGTTFSVLHRGEVKELPPNSEAILEISIEAPSSSSLKSGTYIFNAYVCAKDVNTFNPPPTGTDKCICPTTGDCSTVIGKLYDNIIHKLYVEVP